MAKHKGGAIDSMGGTPANKYKRFKRDKKGALIFKKEPYLGIKHLPPEPKPVPKVVTFEIKLPKIRLPKIPYRKFDKKKVYVAITALASLILIVSLITLAGSSDNNSASNSLDNGDQPTSPSYEPAIPETPQENGSPNPSYDAAKGVTSFNDTIGGVAVTISQQPLPETFKENTEEEIEKLAKAINATKLTVAGEIKVFSAISSEDGSQTSIFTKKKLLIFIRANKALDDNSLIDYVLNLE